MGLRDLGLDTEYRSSDGDLVSRFYVPCLSESRQYWRAVGYFTSSSLALAARGLPPFIAAQGQMRLVASPVVEELDAVAMSDGYRARHDEVARALLDDFHRASPTEIEREQLGFLAWMIAEGLLDIRIAVRVRQGPGIYHEKIGIFVDHDGDSVAFTGSPNETAGGLVSNFESLDVYRSWIEPDRVERKARAFEALWANRTPGLDVVELPHAVRDKLLEYRPPHKPSVLGISREDLQEHTRRMARGLALPSGLEPRQYQLEAVTAWLEAGQGILEMATGTGKTITSLMAAARWTSGGPRSVVVIAAPYIHLVDQWASECRAFGASPVICYGTYRRWFVELGEELRLIRLGLADQAVVLTTHATLMSRRFLAVLAEAGGKVPMLLIADEVHHLGTEAASHSLDGAPWSASLGLSATPSRWLDPGGDAIIATTFGTVVFSYGLAEAIAGGYLTPYEYHPILVDHTDSEFRDYAVLTAQIAVAMRDGDEAKLGFLLRRRAEVLNGASGKLEAIAQLLPHGTRVDHSLVYTTPSRLADITRLLGHDAGLRVHRFTYRESAEERERLLTGFERGDIEVLVAIRCLDEGVDVPATRTAYITASSSNPREFIQRRGRILRRSPGKDAAVIYDLVTVPPAGVHLGASSWQAERSLLRREFVRFFEFADLATNSAEARSKIIDLQDRYQLLDL